MIRQVLTIAEIVLHPSYNKSTFESGDPYDIALLKVSIAQIVDNTVNTFMLDTQFDQWSCFMFKTKI